MAAQRTARQQGRDVVVEELTTETSITVARPDGALRTRVSSVAQRFRDAGGAWRDLDFSIGYRMTQ